MRHDEWVMEREVHQSLEKVSHSFYNGLIQNEESISFEAAKEYDLLIILRWRRRECISCLEAFDITSEGLLYKCGVCIE